MKCLHPMGPMSPEWDEVWERVDGTNNYRCRYCARWWL